MGHMCLSKTQRLGFHEQLETAVRNSSTIKMCLCVKPVLCLPEYKDISTRLHFLSFYYTMFTFKISKRHLNARMIVPSAKVARWFDMFKTFV